MTGVHSWPDSTAIRARAPLDRTSEGPLISVVVPSFNQGQFLGDCLASIAGQDYPNKEIVVMDGGSTDTSVEVIRSYEPHLAYWQSQRDGGQGAAINAGMARAQGDILCWINSDDMMAPEALSRVAELFRKHDPDIVYGDAINLFEGSDEIQYWQAHWVVDSFLDIGGIVSSHSIFWHRRVHQPIWENLKCNIDGELWQRLLPGRRLQHVPLPLGIYRAHEDTKSAADKWAQAWADDDAKIWQRHGRPKRGRLKMQFFAKSQRIYKWLQWNMMRSERRHLIERFGWSDRTWRGPRP